MLKPRFPAEIILLYREEMTSNVNNREWQHA